MPSSNSIMSSKGLWFSQPQRNNSTRFHKDWGNAVRMCLCLFFSLRAWLLHRVPKYFGI
uniref:Uncharacterized protein n=1 Tax=Picea glauca TaxID=3330 RepID=A0A117NFW2_PICGL|nr:hypothetical protein ABT39_MTgene2197 [Picea glauca]